MLSHSTKTLWLSLISSRSICHVHNPGYKFNRSNLTRLFLECGIPVFELFVKQNIMLSWDLQTHEIISNLPP